MSRSKDSYEKSYLRRGFEKPFTGSTKRNALSWREFVDANKTNCLTLALRTRQLVMGAYETKSLNMDNVSAVDLTEIPSDWQTGGWSAQQKAAASLLLQAERKKDLIKAGKSAKRG